MDATTTRRRNILMLVDQFGGPTEFGKRIDRDQAQVSQWTSDAKPKAVGGRLARHIESKLGLASGWLDSPHWEGATDWDSHPVRLDPETIRDIAETLDERYRLDGGFNLAERAQEFARAYELWTGMRNADEPKTLKLVIRHADLSPQGANNGKAGKEAPHTDASGARVRTGSRGGKA